MTLILRAGDVLSPDDTLLIHMGAGDTNALVETSLTNYTQYRPLRDAGGLGLFTLSTYATRHDVPERTVVMTMQHRRFARATASHLLAAGFEVMPTSDFESARNPDQRLLQEVHYDVLLSDVDEERLRTIDNITDDADLYDIVTAHIRPDVERLLTEVFVERIDKYAIYGREQP
jgi:hypothetical protein